MLNSDRPTRGAGRPASYLRDRQIGSRVRLTNRQAEPLVRIPSAALWCRSPARSSRTRRSDAADETQHELGNRSQMTSGRPDQSPYGDPSSSTDCQQERGDALSTSRELDYDPRITRLRFSARLPRPTARIERFRPARRRPRHLDLVGVLTMCVITSSRRGDDQHEAVTTTTSSIARWPRRRHAADTPQATPPREHVENRQSM